MKKFTVLIEDDWEISGNGLGNVGDLQYVPAIRFMDIADSFGIKLTFMVEVAQQLCFIKHQEKDRNIKVQKELWDETVLMMIERGHDVQLHLHPQWLGAEYRDGYFFVNKQWNIGMYDKEVQENLIESSCNYLTLLIKPIYPAYTISAFKGGSWGLQPSENLLNTLSKNGIKIVMGVVKGLEIPEIGVDYKNLEEDTLPYHPNFNDITTVSKIKNEIKILPIPYYEPSLLKLYPYVKHKLKKKIISKLSKSSSGFNVPEEIKKNRPLQHRKKFNVSSKPFKIHLNIGDEPFSVLKNSFDATITRLRKLNQENIPIVIESHTKVFANNYQEIAKFFEYVLKTYSSEVEFSTLSDYVKKMNKD